RRSTYRKESPRGRRQPLRRCTTSERVTLEAMQRLGAWALQHLVSWIEPDEGRRPAATPPPARMTYVGTSRSSQRHVVCPACGGRSGPGGRVTPAPDPRTCPDPPARP